MAMAATAGVLGEGDTLSDNTSVANRQVQPSYVEIFSRPADPNNYRLPSQALKRNQNIFKDLGKDTYP
jgi:hypothetical protein